ncbi:2-phytyl-1,4-beta-naphthoquinone methyltransferase, chloroplastic-like isoform X2 [Quercus robur]|uniref:2-phytyl-1,4-beta-naphthoquinone methyltransferase, chloroplastic-like isoform X2 n=1 Tax=Quercus robur TaxID=38942 RepID=UPI0021631019|nr:2-phytyl-1,4-beta-naphthoquinone methyltransferase, chloroplastic-like isoform X2 [Quercus robur]
MGDCALDLCCGSGDLAFLLFEKVGSNGKVTGLDFSKEQLSIASCRQGLALNACYNNIEWVEGDALELPFSDGYFDAITMGYGLRNVVDKERSMQEMFRVLKPGSRVSVLDFNKSTQPFTNLIQIVTYVYYNKKLQEFFILFLVLKFKYSIVILGLSELNICILEFTCHD